jgi:anti-sigma regulatory factor (Ser/Thr protein kinase)
LGPLESDRPDDGMITLSASPTSAALARQFTRRALGDYESETVDTVQLLVSELSTNALRQGGSLPGLEIEMDLDRGSIRVTVSDNSPAAPLIRAGNAYAEGGRGMQLVEALSQSWGWAPMSDGKCVWFIVGPPPTV